MEKKVHFNFALGIEEGKQIKRAQLELSESFGVKQFYGRALVRGAAELLKESGGGIVPIDEAAFIEKVKAEARAKKATAERERRAKKRCQK